MSVTFESLTDKQKWAIEARLRANEDPELRHRPLMWIGQDRRGYGLVKSKFQTALGLGGRESGWVIDNYASADFSQITTAGALTFRTIISAFPLINPAHIIASYDQMPFEQSTLTAITGDRQIGTSSQAQAIALAFYVVHITSGGAVYQPATTTINIRVASASGATIGAFTTQATINVATAANAIDQIPIAATTGRHVSITGTDLTNILSVFNGDTLFAELVLGGATTIQGNILAVLAEIV